MNYALLAAAALGFQWGYESLENGTVEYTIQLGPKEARHLEDAGEAIVSYVPAEAQPVDRIRIVVGEQRLPRGDAITETQFRAVAGYTQDPHAAGPLVSVATPPVGQDVRSSSESLRLTTSEGGAVDAPPASQEAGSTNSNPEGATGDVAPPQPLPREGFRRPVYTVNDGTEGPSDVPTADEQDTDASPPETGPSPSDLAVGDQFDETSKLSRESDPSEDRPWLPLVSTAAVAFGCFAGNVFQWRSYVSLRKRYLHLLRTTGG